MILDNTDPTNRNGLIQLLEDETGTKDSSVYPKATKVRDLNLSLNRFMFLAIKASRRWHVDDTNHPDYAIISTNLVSGRQDYPFLLDGSAVQNQILDIYRVEVADQNGTYREISEIDLKNIQIGLSDYKPDGGVPDEYNKDGNSVKLYTIPNYNYANGLRLYIARTPSYFLPTDTTKSAGVPWLLEPFLVYDAGYNYCARNGLPQAGGRLKTGGYVGLALQVQKYEEMIGDYYSDRAKDVPRRLIANRENTR